MRTILPRSRIQKPPFHPERSKRLAWLARGWLVQRDGRRGDAAILATTRIVQPRSLEVISVVLQGLILAESAVRGRLVLRARGVRI